jgi:O-antigen/teichoic acid export membrane protein
LPIATACAVLSHPVIHILFGPQYERAGNLVVAMSFAGILMILNSVVINATFGCGRLWHGFFINLSWLILFLVIGCVLIPAWGAAGLAWTFVLSYAPLALSGGIYVVKVLGAKFKKIPLLLAMTALAFSGAIVLHKALQGTPLLISGCVMILILVLSEWVWVCDDRERIELRSHCLAFVRPLFLRRLASPRVCPQTARATVINRQY